MHPPPHQDIADLAFLIGTWTGSGHGDYPTVTAFDYDEEVVISAMPKPILAYTQRTRRQGTGDPLHAEFGYIRLPDGSPELVICQPTGIVEVHSGQRVGQTITWQSTSVAVTDSAAGHGVTDVMREVSVDGDVMRYRVHMAAAGQVLQLHLEARLDRTGT